MFDYFCVRLLELIDFRDWNVKNYLELFFFCNTFFFVTLLLRIVSCRILYVKFVVEIFPKRKEKICGRIVSFRNLHVRIMI